jgi:peptide/nickel transport system substrate-binding protein
MKLVLRNALAAAAIASTLILSFTAAGPAMAATPKDMFVMATFLDEFTTLDPGEVYELVPEEYVANTYDRLVRVDLKDPSKFNGDVAQSWAVSPDGLTFTFKIRPGLKFHSGNPLTADDVAWSIRSMTNGVLVTAKGGSFNDVTAVDVRNPLTVVVHTRAPLASLLFNLSDGLFGVVENGAGSDEGLHPIGTGPFRFIDQLQDKEVVVESNPTYWAGAPNIGRVRFEVVPDTITAALEMKKGSADVESNVLTLDMVHALRQEPNLRVDSGSGARVDYVNFNVQDPALRDKRVRQAIACAIDKDALIAALWRGQAGPADTLLPPGHWAAVSLRNTHTA